MTWDELLLEWYAAQGRKLPWRETTDPYAVLVAEIMLQQTQVDRVVPKYLAWLAAFPTWQALALAPRSQVLTHWSGLGYNSRAVRLQTLVKLIVAQYDGILPQDELTLRTLPGIGPYTAGSVRCFAFDLPGECIDVNVERVIKRTAFTRRQRPERKHVSEKLFLLQQKHSPRDLANALMDLGSTYCIAKKPSCANCPVRDACLCKGERKEEALLREKKKQSTFVYSNRWWRGRILKELTKGPRSDAALFTNVCDDSAQGMREQSYRTALAQLKEEQVVAGDELLVLVD